LSVPGESSQIMFARYTRTFHPKRVSTNSTSHPWRWLWLLGHSTEVLLLFVSRTAICKLSSNSLRSWHFNSDQRRSSFYTPAQNGGSSWISMADAWIGNCNVARSSLTLVLG
jgi:hypothetical protein